MFFQKNFFPAKLIALFVLIAYIYTERDEWIKELQLLCELTCENKTIKMLYKDKIFEGDCRERFVEAIKFLKAQGKWECWPGQISRSFRDWLTRSWKDRRRREIMNNIAMELRLDIDVNEETSYKKLSLR